MKISNLFAGALLAGAAGVVAWLVWTGPAPSKYAALVAILLGLGMVLWARRSRSFTWHKPAALAFGMLIAFVLGEVVVRLAETTWGNRIPGSRMGTDDASMFQPDAALGYVTRPNTWTYRWNRDVTTLDDGIRSNGRPIVADPERTILVVGDSFTYGDEVGDTETWPAQLEAILGESGENVRVVNAGVSGYGLDQMVLRADPLIDEYDVDLVILLMFAGSEERCGYSVKWGMPKPWYSVEDGRLVLHDQLEPRPVGSDANPLGRSALVDLAMRRIAPEWWLRNTEEASIRAANLPHTVGPALIDHLAEWARSQRCEVIVVYQGEIGVREEIVPEPPESWTTNRLTVTRQPNPFLSATADHASKLTVDGYAYLDLRPKFQELYEANEERFCSYYNTHWSQHWTAKGNEQVARWVAEFIADRNRSEEP